MKKLLLITCLAIAFSGVQAIDGPNGAIDSAYHYLQVKYYEGIWSTWAGMPEYSSDDAVVVGAGPADRPELHTFDNYQVNDTNFAVRQLWRRDYHALHYVNRAISLITPGDNVTLAEMYFLRAYYHFEMLRFFGDVPIHEIVVPLNKYLDKSNSEQVFASVVKDLNNSIQYLPEKSARLESEKAKATKGAAEALLGKVYLYMASPLYNQGIQYYDSAYSKLQQVINSSEYSLEPTYSDIWRLEHELGVESVFEIEYESEPSYLSFWSNGYEANSNIDVQLNGPIFSDMNDSINSGWGMEMLTKNLADAYKAEGDSVRKHGTILAAWQLKLLGITYINSLVENYTSYYTAKRASWKYLNPFSGMWSYPTNERIIRYADVLLMAAEALNQKQSPDDATALSYINTVRNRAGLASISLTGTSLYAAIKKERRLELADEGQRFFDLVRWNDAASKLGPLGFVSGKDEHYPIPFDVILGGYVSANGVTNNEGFSIFPVPSQGEIFLKYDKAVNIERIEIYNTAGAIVFSTQVDNHKNNFKINLSFLNKGIYAAKVYSDENVVVKKIILN
jgi:starch-binding outer membrane protein, SusD/RagB family